MLSLSSLIWNYLVSECIWETYGDFSILLLYQAVAKMVQQCCTYVEDITDLPVKLRLIDTLRTVTEGKVRFCFKTEYLKGRIKMLTFFKSIASECHFPPCSNESRSIFLTSEFLSQKDYKYFPNFVIKWLAKTPIIFPLCIYLGVLLI